VNTLKVKTVSPATLLGLFTTLIGFWLIAKAYYTAARLLNLTGPWTAPIYTLAQITGFTVLLYVLKKENQPFSSIWFGEGRLKDLSYAALFLTAAWVLWGILDYTGAVLGIPKTAWWKRWQVSSPPDIIPVAILALAAAFFEEIFYRGYAITRLYSLTNNLALASAVSIGFFTLIHCSFGPRTMLCILGWTTIDTLLFIHRKSTKASFYYHAINNTIVYIIFPLTGLWK